MPQVVLLGAAVAAVLTAHRAVRPALSVAVVVAIGLASGIVEADTALDALRPLRAPLGFLAAAVPVAVLLDRIGFFAVAADWVTARRFAQGDRLPGALWVFGALVTTLFNLDAAIVLLTPLYVRIAVRRGLDPVRLGFQTVLLASLASSALPVSNLTNLIVAEARDVGVADFLVRLGLASLAATAIGWLAYRTLPGRVGTVPELSVTDSVGPARAPAGLPGRHGSTTGQQGEASDRAWRVGGPAVVALLVGFTLGDVIGIPAWVVATVIAAALALATRHAPWRAVPIEALVVAAGLAVLTGAAANQLDVGRVLGGTGPLAELRAFGAGVVGANAVNNLPALLVGLPDLTGATVWAYLIAVNVGPTLWISGSLAGLLWADVMAAHGHPVTAGEYARVGVRVGVPALVVAGAVTIGVSRLL